MQINVLTMEINLIISRVEFIESFSRIQLLIRKKYFSNYK